ncbi:DUF342 domain-containing protein [Azonexus sp.]|uniref:DUF342 domain-containing protein n=1 Tax=Azonexus sp. TaxID=1872668 RepID=UPI0039E30C30
MATVVPDPEAGLLDEPLLREMIAAEGWGELRYLSDMSLGLISSHNAGTACSLPIAEAVDARIQLELSSDAMEAWLSLMPAEGGKSVCVETVLDLLAENNVAEGIDMPAIEAALLAGKIERAVIARGKRPVNGADGRLESLIPEVRDRRPRINLDGYTDYRDLGDIFVVRAGDWLMLRHPPGEGEVGRNLLGAITPAIPGKTVMFASTLSGTAFDPENPNLLVAAITGQPVVVPGGMIVEPVYKVAQVSMATGNIEFDGSVVVTGDVCTGMKVRATGDIEVGGVVDMGTLEAGGNIVVKGGVLGALGRKTSEECAVHCDGNFHAVYAQQAKVSAGDTIFIDDTAIQCELSAVNHVKVGGKKRGNIVGGSVQATYSIAAKVLGSPNRSLTRCYIGVNPNLLQEVQELAKVRDGLETQLLEVSKLLDFAAKNPGRMPPHMIEKARVTAAQLSQQIAEKRAQQEVLQQQLELAQGARVVAEQLLYDGVEVHFGAVRYKVAGEHAGCAVANGENGPELQSLK